MQRLADELPAERTASRFIVSTDPDEHVAAIERYLDLGFTHLVFHAPGPGPGEVPAPLRRRNPAPAAQATGVTRHIDEPVAEIVVRRARQEEHELVGQRLGFRRDPELDWTPAPGVTLLGYRIDLVQLAAH